MWDKNMFFIEVMAQVEEHKALNSTLVLLKTFYEIKYKYMCLFTHTHMQANTYIPQLQVKNS
jgi:hypothetical protein